MGAPTQRRPGQSNAEYEHGPDPNADFLGTHSLFGGGDATWVFRLLDWVSARRRDRKR